MTDLGHVRAGSYVANVAEHLALQQRRHRVGMFVGVMVTAAGVGGAVLGASGSPVGLVMAVLLLPLGFLLVSLEAAHGRRLTRSPLPTGFAPPARWPLDTDRGARTFAAVSGVVVVGLILFTWFAGDPSLVVGAVTALLWMLVTTVGAALVALGSSTDPLSLLATRLQQDPQARADLDLVRRGLQHATGTVPFT